MGQHFSNASCFYQQAVLFALLVLCSSMLCIGSFATGNKRTMLHVSVIEESVTRANSTRNRRTAAAGVHYSLMKAVTSMHAEHMQHVTTTPSLP